MFSRFVGKDMRPSFYHDHIERSMFILPRVARLFAGILKYLMQFRQCAKCAP